MARFTILEKASRFYAVHVRLYVYSMHVCDVFGDMHSIEYSSHDTSLIKLCRPSTAHLGFVDLVAVVNLAPACPRWSGLLGFQTGPAGSANIVVWRVDFWIRRPHLHHARACMRSASSWHICCLYPESQSGSQFHH